MRLVQELCLHHVSVETMKYIKETAIIAHFSLRKWVFSNVISWAYFLPCFGRKQALEITILPFF